MEENNENLNDDESQDNDIDESIKVVLIGESGVGKTSIISQFTKGVFNIDLMSTNGATFCTKKKEFKEFKKSISFEIWDTAGQEKYRSLAKMFFKDAAVALIVYDITSKKSFDEIKNYWMNLVKENGPKQIIMYIVGNKSDLNEQITEEEARKYAESLGIPLWFTSAKDSTGIEELFEEIGKKYLSPEFSNNEEIIQRKMRKNEVTKVNKEAASQDNQNASKKGCCG